jgi:hypothetical protein
MTVVLVVPHRLIMCERVDLAKAEMNASLLLGLMPKGVPFRPRPASHRPPDLVSTDCSNTHSSPRIQLHRIFLNSNRTNGSQSCAESPSGLSP